jgi:hypothetical protein
MLKFTGPYYALPHELSLYFSDTVILDDPCRLQINLVMLPFVLCLLWRDSAPTLHMPFTYLTMPIYIMSVPENNLTILCLQYIPV